jgi:hypothetical protein
MIIENPSDAIIEMSNLSGYAPLKTAIGDISTALDELHTYAQALIGGEA